MKKKQPVKSDVVEIEVINKRLGSLPPGMQLAVKKTEAEKLIQQGRVKAVVAE